MSLAVFVTNSAAHFVPSRLPLARRVLNSGYEVHVVVPEIQEAEHAELQALGAKVHLYPLGRRSLNPLSEIWSVIQLYRLYRRLKPGMVHHFTIKPCLYGGIAARLAGVPIRIQTFTGLGFLFTTRNPLWHPLRFFVARAMRFALRSTARSQSGVIFQNHADQKELERHGALPRVPAEVILGTGVDLDLFRPADEPGEPLIVALPARMLAHKGVHEFVAAVRSLREKETKFEAWLVGDVDRGNPSAIAETTLRGWENEGWVKWKGFHSDMAALYRKVHLVCLPSYREGIPRVLMEALASERAVVTTRVPGCMDVVSDGEEGLVVEPRDSQALAEALDRLLRDAELRRKLARKGRRKAQIFSVNRINDEIMGFYRRVTETAPL